MGGQDSRPGKGGRNSISAEVEGPLLSVLCITYNQVGYIEHAITSILSQRTNFTFEVLVHDDASTDGTAETLRKLESEFPQLHVVYEVENRFSQGKSCISPLLKQARGKYYALVEGDDYWTCCDKLEMQVAFLESHPAYSLCVHAGTKVDRFGNLIPEGSIRPFTQDCTVPLEAILSSWLFPTASMVVRADQFNPCPEFQGNAFNGDFAVTVDLAMKGKVFYFDKEMSAYRVQSLGSMTERQSRDISISIDYSERFVAMLERIDSYTNYKYSDVIKEHKDKILFDLSLAKGDYLSCITYSKFKALPLRCRLKCFLRWRVPSMYSLVRRIAKRD